MQIRILFERSYYLFIYGTLVDIYFCIVNENSQRNWVLAYSVCCEKYRINSCILFELKLLKTLKCWDGFAYSLWGSNNWHSKIKERDWRSDYLENIVNNSKTRWILKCNRRNGLVKLKSYFNALTLNLIWI